MWATTQLTHSNPTRSRSFIVYIVLLIFFLNLPMSEKQRPNTNPDGDLYAKDVYGTNYTYFQARHTLFNDYLFSFKRAIANVNPFAY
jgi:hypothetical protein